MSDADKKFRNEMIAFIAQLESADQPTKEYAANHLKNGLEGKLTGDAQAFVDDLCELILTGEPNDVAKYLGLVS